jgi:alpha-amylase/alpha-mannosidase (GH57 family)
MEGEKLMNRFLCIHGHFYQPPRENAWLEAIEIQDSAFPFHDWNERITAECYSPNSAARILDPDQKIVDIKSNYAKISFNFGPTLLSWMESHAPAAYEAILKADKESMENFSGHGSALAQIYNHMIMPLANRRDKETQVIWGISDFEHRFGRKPEGMWLPETAVDIETLEVLAESDIKFTILSPHQAKAVRKIGAEDWKNVEGGKVNPRRPYLCRLPSGKEIVLFFYDGPISQELGFGNLLDDGKNFANRLTDAFLKEEDEAQLVHIATDGETYGHHRHHGDMALAYCLDYIEKNDLAKLTNYGEFLEFNPRAFEAQIIENTSWSCVHGIERWRSDCGCNSGMHPGWNQKWRKPLREAMNWLRDSLITIYENKASGLMDDPWQVRDKYISVILNRSAENVEKFISENTKQELKKEEKVTFLKLMEMQRHAMLIFTSCGWFFDEISGMESTQVIQYADRAIQLASQLAGAELEPEFQERLRSAESNIPGFQNGAWIYNHFVKPSRLDLLRVGIHYAISSLFTEDHERNKIYCYSLENSILQLIPAGRIKLGLGRTDISSDITREESVVSFAVLYLGGHILNGGIREYMGDEDYHSMENEIKESFRKSDIPEVFRLMDSHFGSHNYTLWHLFRDERRKVFNEVLRATNEKIEFHFRKIYEDDYTLLQAMKEMQIPMPKAISAPLEFILNTDLRRELDKEVTDFDRMERLIKEFQKWDVPPEQPAFNYIASHKIDRLMEKLSGSPFDLAIINTIRSIITSVEKLSVNLDFWLAQNIYFRMAEKYRTEMSDKAGNGDDEARNWLDAFNALGALLRVKA